MSKEQTYIVFLRGVTPTGKNKVPMAELRTALADAGFGDVKTWIQSGNAIVKTELSREETAEFVHRTIREKIGPDLPIIVKTAEELKAVLEENPFLHLAQDRIFYGLTNEEYSDESIERVLGSNYGEDQISFTDHAIYLYIRKCGTEQTQQQQSRTETKNPADNQKPEHPLEDDRNGTGR